MLRMQRNNTNKIEYISKECSLRNNANNEIYLVVTLKVSRAQKFQVQQSK